MTEHSVEELKRQYDNAASKANQARLDELAARRRLHSALCRESGWMGKTVTSARKGFSLVVHDIDFICGKPWVLKGFKIKKDGTVGNAEGRVYVEELSR